MKDRRHKGLGRELPGRQIVCADRVEKDHGNGHSRCGLDLKGVYSDVIAKVI